MAEASETPKKGAGTQHKQPISPLGGQTEVESAYRLFRAEVYALLGSLLAEAPSQRLLDWLQQLEADRDRESLMADAWDSLRRAAGEVGEGAVAEEFQELFIGLGRGEVMPFGSWYLSGFLMERPLVKLRADLALLGLERNAGVKEPEDHIAALCQVMAMLLQPEPGISEEQAEAFLVSHLQPFAEQFFIDLQMAPSARFYRAVGRLGEAFMQQEKTKLETTGGRI